MKKYDKNRLNYIKSLNLKGQFEDALTEVLSYVGDYPNDYLGKLYYAIILEKIGKYEEAKDIFILIANNPVLSPQARTNAISQLGELYLSKIQDPEKAKECFEKCIKEDPEKYSYAYVGLAKIEISKHRPQKALRILNKYTGNDRMTDILMTKAKIYIELEKYDYALEIINKVRQKDLSLEYIKKINIIKAKIEWGKSNYYKAVEYLKKAAVKPISSAYKKAIFERVRVEEYFGNYEEAIKLCEEIKIFDEKYRDFAYIVEGNICAKLNEFDNAKNKYLKIKDDSKRNQYFGIMEFNRENYEKAIEYFNNSDSEISNLYKAISCYRLKNFKDSYDIVSKIDITYMDHYDRQAVKRLTILSEKKLGYNYTIPLTYTEYQLTNYSKKRALEHIDRDHIKKDHAIFDKNVDIEYLIDNIKELVKAGKLVKNELFKTYEIPYEGIGYVDGKKVNSFLAIVTDEECKVITMFPYKSKKIYDQPKIKQKSAIDKFYERYGKM